MARRPYLDKFNPKEYLRSFYGSSEENTSEKSLFEFYREQLHKFYTKYKSKWNNKTARLLEFGGGPVISNLITGMEMQVCVYT